MNEGIQRVGQLHDAVGAPASIADDPIQIRIWQMTSAKRAIKLEMLGMRHSRLRGGAKKLWAHHFKIQGRPTHQEVIDRLEQEITRYKEAYANGQRELEF